MAFRWWQSFTGRPSRERRELRDEVAALEREYGSTKAAAEAMGVSRAALWRLKTGRTRTPRPDTVHRIRAVRRRAASTPGRRALVDVKTSPRTSPSGVDPRFMGTYTVNGTYTRSSPFRLHKPAALGSLRASHDAWLAGDTEGAHALLEAALTAEIGHDVTVQDGRIDWHD